MENIEKMKKLIKKLKIEKRFYRNAWENALDEDNSEALSHYDTCITMIDYILKLFEPICNDLIQDLEIAQIFKNRMRILERDNYKVIKVDIFSDVPGFVEEYNKIIDWNGDCNE